jgi:hypothetical protein
MPNVKRSQCSSLHTRLAEQEVVFLFRLCPRTILFMEKQKQKNLGEENLESRYYGVGKNYQSRPQH